MLMKQKSHLEKPYKIIDNRERMKQMILNNI